MMGGNRGSVMTKAARLVKKDGYILMVMMLTVPLAGEPEVLSAERDLQGQLRGSDFLLSFAAAAECAGCAVRLFNGGGSRRISCAA